MGGIGVQDEVGGPGRKSVVGVDVSPAIAAGIERLASLDILPSPPATLPFDSQAAARPDVTGHTQDRIAPPGIRVRQVFLQIIRSILVGIGVIAADVFGTPPPTQPQPSQPNCSNAVLRAR